jgi:amidase
MRQALDRKELSAAELLQSHLQQIERLNPKLRAFTNVLAPVQAFDGPLAGIPVSIKDSLDIAGEATLCGLPSRAGHRASRDAVCVDRLRRAGAVILGKTNTPEWLMNWETRNEAFGETLNPWDLGRSAGGSSGGESAAIASCMSAGGIGSDGGGSIRLPAALTGICGLKPTPGRVPATGHFPTVGHPGGLLGVIGPMARTVEDVETLFRVVRGHADSDPFSVPMEPLPVQMPERVGVVGHPVVSGALEWVEGEIIEFPAQPWERIFDVWRFFFLRVNAHAIGSPTTHTAWYLDQPAPTMGEMLEMFAARDALRGKFLAALDECPILLLPNPGFGAWKLGKFPGVESMAPLTVANLLGLPALAIPVGFDSAGMPLSIQAVAKPWREELLLEFGKRFEAARGRFPLAPMVGGL